MRESVAKVTATVTEGIAGYAVIKAFGREREQLRIVQRDWQRYRDDIQKAQFFSLVPAGMIELLAGLGLILVVAVGGDLTLRGIVPVADLFVFVVYLGLIYQPVIQLAAISENIQKAMASTERVFELLAHPNRLARQAERRGPVGARVVGRVRPGRLPLRTGGTSPARRVLQRRARRTHRPGRPHRRRQIHLRSPGPTLLRRR